MKTMTCKDLGGGRWRRPISGMGWYKVTKRRFAELPED